MTQLEISQNPKSQSGVDYLLIAIAGQIDESNLAELAAVADQLPESAQQFILFDIARLEFINSKVIGYLAGLHSQLDAAGKSMLFFAPNEQIRDILELVGMDTIIPLKNTETEALQAIRDGDL